MEYKKLGKLINKVVESVAPYILDTVEDSNYDDIGNCMLNTSNGFAEIETEVFEDCWLTYKLETSDGDNLRVRDIAVTFYGVKDIYYELNTTQNNTIKKRITELTTIN